MSIAVPEESATPNFRTVAEGLGVAAALAEIRALPDYQWLRMNNDHCLYAHLLDNDLAPVLIDELPETWWLIAHVRELLAAHHDDEGILSYCRIGIMPPGEGLAPHFDGIDGVIDRRYQLALQSAPGVELTVGGEMKCPKPGDVWRIEASRTHSVYNHSPIDRITLLFDTVRKP